MINIIDLLANIICLVCAITVLGATWRLHRLVNTSALRWMMAAFGYGVIIRLLVILNTLQITAIPWLVESMVLFWIILAVALCKLYNVIRYNVGK